MTTHAKSGLCSICSIFKQQRREYFKSPCPDCRSYGRSFNFYVLLRMKAQLNDMQQEIDSLRLSVQGFYRWVACDLKPLLESVDQDKLQPVFQKAHELAGV